jgi:hypothetical protein
MDTGNVLFTKGSVFAIKHYPRCSTKCTETCSPCVVNGTGTYTGRYWRNEVLQVTYYEVKYRKESQTEIYTGIFTASEMTLIKAKSHAQRKISGGSSGLEP